MTETVLVVGAGMAGLAAAREIEDRGGHAFVVDAPIEALTARQDDA